MSRVHGRVTNAPTTRRGAAERETKLGATHNRAAPSKCKHAQLLSIT